MYAALYSRTPSAWHWAGPGRCQLACGSSWGMICPLCDMWCRFSPWKSDFHNISTSVTHKHRNYPQQTRNSFEKYLTAEGDLWIEGCDIKAQVHWHCSKVDSGQGLAGRVVAVAPTWSLSLSMVIEVDWQHCQEDTANPKSAKSSQESWKKSWLLLLSQYHEWLTFSFCSFHWFNNCELKSTQVQEWYASANADLPLYAWWMDPQGCRCRRGERVGWDRRHQRARKTHLMQWKRVCGGC